MASRGAGVARRRRRPGTGAVTAPASRRGHQSPGIIVIAGPDGAGKSTLAEAVVATLPPDKVLWLHHRPRLLPSRSGGGPEPVTDPYGRAPYPPAVGALKVVYYWLDYVLGWLLHVRPVVRAGGTAVIERGWMDLAADPRRYRLAGVEPLVRVLGRLLPATTRTFRLTAPVELLLERTGDDLTAAELQGQLDAQGRVLRGDGVVVLDARQPVEELRDEVVAQLSAPSTTARHVGAVPSTANPRWLLPRTPNAVAAGALRIHRPMTPKAAAVWCAAGAAARFGAARLLQGADDAEAAVFAAVDPWVPAGGGVAVARSTHPARHHALVVDGAGRPVLHLKVAADDAGRTALDVEAGHLDRYGPLLTPPLRAPRLVHAGPGLLVTEAVSWRLVRRPWRLDPAVASALGAFWGGGGGEGRAHGDVAPWNLLPVGGEWVLVDWEMAQPGSPAFFDLVHWVVMAQSHLRHPTPAELRSGLAGEGWIGACVRAYASAAGLPTSALGEGIARYLELTGQRTSSDAPTAAREAATRDAIRSLAR